MIATPTINAALRIPDVMISRASLEAAIGPLDRWVEASAARGTSYAQVNAEGCDWSDIALLIERVGPTLVSHLVLGEIGRPSLDFASFIGGDRMTASVRVPHEVVSAVGRMGFELEVSAYLTDDE